MSVHTAFTAARCRASRPVINNLWLPKIPNVLPSLMFERSWIRFVRDVRPRLTGPDGPKLSSVAGCTAPGGTRLAAPASGAESVATATVAARDRGPLALGVVIEVVDLLENRTRHRQTGNRHRLASQELPHVLDVEKSLTDRKSVV